MIATILLVANFAQANVFKSYTGVNSIDKSPCTIELIKTSTGIEAKIAAKVLESRVVYGEELVDTVQTDFILKNQSHVEKSVIYINEQSSLILKNNGFIYSAKSKKRLYEGDYKASATAVLDLTKGTFEYNANSLGYLVEANGLSSIFSLDLSADIKAKEKAFCYNVK